MEWNGMEWNGMYFVWDGDTAVKIPAFLALLNTTPKGCAPEVSVMAFPHLSR